MILAFTPLAARVRGLPWPLPAVLSWALGWAVWMAAGAVGLAAAAGFAAGLLASAAVAACCRGRWRQAIAAAGFPLSALALGLAGAMPPWVWLAVLLPLLLAYPLRAWRDAPFFPTPAHALQGLDRAVTEAPQRVLDAGCGLGHGLRALHALWPQAQLHGIEWSAPLAALAALRCGFAHIRRGDMWAASWTGHDLVYLFQRPESMARAWAKACAELAPGAWLVSLEFEVPGVSPQAVLRDRGRPVWTYRVPSPPISGSTASAAGR